MKLSEWMAWFVHRFHSSFKVICESSSRKYLDCYIAPRSLRFWIDEENKSFIVGIDEADLRQYSYQWKEESK